MKYLILFCGLFSVIFSRSYALDVGDITSFIYSDQNTMGKEIANPTDNGRLITLRIEKLSSPLADGKIITTGNSRREVLMTPASLLLPAHSKEIVRFYYQGPADNQERYYRIDWRDQSLSRIPAENTAREAVATSSAQIGTLLVVAPRQVRYAWQYRNSTLFNTGNATLRVVAYGPCRSATDGKECRENYYLLPGKNRAFSRVNVAIRQGHIGLWQAATFVAVK